MGFLPHVDRARRRCAGDPWGPIVARMKEAARSLPLGGLLQLLASVVLLSSAWPLTKIALASGTTPLWFAEGRAVLSGLTAAGLLLIVGRFRVPTRPDLPAILAVGGLQLGAYFALAHE